MNTILAIAVLTLGVASYCSGDWPMFRHDTHLTGRSPLKGDIAKPVVKDKLFAGAYEGLAVVRPDAASATLTAGKELDPGYWTAHASEWNTEGALATSPEKGFGDSHGGFVKLIPDLDARQKLWFEDAFAATETQRGFLYAYDQPDGKERVVWQTELEKDMWSPIVLLTDADGDGVLDAVIATHYRVMVYDTRTGAKKMELRWHDMRNYGYFGCFTVPGERLPKFVVITDFVSHIDILNNDGKKLDILWRKDLEPTIIRKDKITRPGPNPIADIDGDGRVEITINLFNQDGDQQWHVTSFDALTGDIRFDLPKTYLHGIADVDGDGLPELFLEETSGLPTPRFGQIRLVSMKGGKQKALWSSKRAAWQTTDLTVLPFTSNTMAALGRRTVLLADGPKGRTAFAVTPGEGERESLVSIGRGANGKWSVQSTVTGPARARIGLKAVRSGAEGTEMLVSWRSDGEGVQKLQTRNAEGEVVSYRSVPGPTPVPVTARLRKDEPPTLIFQNGAEHIVAYQKARSGWKLRWKQAGRGATMEGSSFYGVIAADVDGDGELETLFARPSKSGEAEIVAVGPGGKIKWQHAFPGFDGGIPVWNLGGMIWWSVGHFTSRERFDVFANPRRSTMHSYEGFLLSGIDGRQIWRQDAVDIPGTGRDSSRSYAGLFTAAADVNGDGLDELVCENPDRFWYADGRTGEVQKVTDTAGVEFPGMWVAYATPIMGDLQGTGHLQALWGGSGYLTALMTTDGKPIWYGKYRDGASAMQSFGDVEGIGRPLIGGVGYSDGFRCYDPKDGSVRWTYPLPATTPGHTIAADVNGDGLEEFVFTQERTVYALNGKGGKANLVWSLELPAAPGPLAFADADGDGKPELIVGAADGYVYVVGGTDR